MKRLLTACMLVAIGMTTALVSPTMSQAASAPAHAAAAAAGTCLNVQPAWWEFYANTWTGWQQTVTTTKCRDLNVKITNYSCAAVIHAEYYKASTGQWIPAAAGDIVLQPGQWYTPITNLKDNVPIRFQFKPYCTDERVDVWYDA